MINLESVTKSYPVKNDEEVTALDNINITINDADFATVIGVSGSGKSTMLFTIGGMLKPTGGTVEVGEIDVYSLSSSKLAKFRRTYIGFVFQTFNLVPYLTCLENVALPAILTGSSKSNAFEHARQMLDRLGLSQRLNHKPNAMSVGERQRVAIVRSLINEPEILLADEPTGNLDPETSAEVMKLLKEINSEGQTIMMVTHDPVLAKTGNRLIRLNEGRIEENRHFNNKPVLTEAVQ